MTTFAPPTSPDVAPNVREDTTRISRVPYLAGLDGMRALAVIAVMIYHANSTWLPGGFLGVEMFFVISGYLITLLIIAERERSYRVSLVDFWKRRARRLLPALYLLLLLVTVYTAIFEAAALGQLRGDVIAGLLYVSNWYQLFVGLGYTAAFDFAPLRHLWSLAVEEQFYLLWPLIMVALLGRKGTRRVADVSRWVFVAAVAIAVATALLYHPGVIGEPDTTPDAYWFIGNHPISKLDFLYIGTISRLSGILLGAAFAMVWRPFAVIRGPLRSKGRLFDVTALIALGGFGWMCWNVYLVTPSGVADPMLFRGGLFLASILTLGIIAAVCHPAARANRVLGNPLLRWIGLRSYGLYLYHWPVYQAMRELAGNKLNLREFVIALLITAVITEISYRFVETPIRTGSFRTTLRRIGAAPNPLPRRVLVSAGAIGLATALFAGAALATADLEGNEIVDAFAANEPSTIDLGEAVSLADGDGSTSPTPLDDPFTNVDPSTSSPALAATTIPPSTVLPSTVAPSTVAVTSTAHYFCRPFFSFINYSPPPSFNISVSYLCLVFLFPFVLQFFNMFDYIRVF